MFAGRFLKQEKTSDREFPLFLDKQESLIILKLNTKCVPFMGSQVPNPFGMSKK